MQKFKKGDKARNKVGVEGIVTCWDEKKGRGVINVPEDDRRIFEDCDICHTSDHFHGHYIDLEAKLISSATEIMTNFVKLTENQIDHLDSNSQALIKVGAINGDLTVFSQSKILDMLLRLNYSELAVLAQEEIEKAEAVEKKAKK